MYYDFIVDEFYDLTIDMGSMIWSHGYGFWNKGIMKRVLLFLIVIGGKWF